ncbi:two-component sensor histidine kinase [Anseongella ginsenosidimutans]|uniref:histidine kinase n=1 Tax=Anseongella ginsenosidimutans TaxID=496056 RepID=A0A4V2UTL3_9SPHI|nr:sensor histidine kinase [Anseongella ginsenosidimutans]QEC52641.1 sensor histidine kinase [Anseongella ginsenosidimutans]TCS86566.1 two-component sensor histidine kinase [Anseongella ginsenosidimutans]
MERIFYSFISLRISICRGCCAYRNCCIYRNRSVSLNRNRSAYRNQSVYRDYGVNLNRNTCLLLFSLFLLSVSCADETAVNPAENIKAEAGYKASVDSLYRQSNYYKDSGHDSLKVIARQLVVLGETNKDAEAVVRGTLLNANYEWMRANYPEAIRLAVVALGKAQENGLKKQIPQIYATIGNLHKENENYATALDAAEKGIRAAREIRDTAQLIYLLRVKAMFTHSFGMLKNNDSIRAHSLQLHMEGLKLAESGQAYERSRIAYYDNISQYYKINGVYDLGIYYGHKGAELAKKYSQRRSLTYAYNWLGESYFYKGQQEKGIAYMKDALQIALELKSTYRAMEIHCSLYECYHSINDDKNALAHFVRYRGIHDSLEVLKNVKKIGQIHLQYETEQKDQQIASLGAINEEKTRRNMLILVGLFLLLCLSGFLYRQYRAIGRRNRLLTESNHKINKQSEQLQLLMKELHHRVKNNLQIVSSLLSLQSNHLEDKDAQQAVRIGQQRIEAMSLIHRSLYQRDTPNSVNMREYVKDLVESIIQSFGFDKNRFDLKLEVDTAEVDVDMALPLGLIINEWVTNAFKHAYKDVRRPLLWLSLKQDGGIQLEIRDNGPGMDADSWERPAGSFGVKLVKVLSRQLKGVCEMKRAGGTAFTLRIPLQMEKAV